MHTHRGEVQVHVLLRPHHLFPPAVPQRQRGESGSGAVKAIVNDVDGSHEAPPQGEHGTQIAKIIPALDRRYVMKYRLACFT